MRVEYVLEAVNGAPPPQVIFENEAGRLLMVEGQMALLVDGRYIQQINFEQMLTDGGSVRTSRICEGEYSLGVTRLELTEDDCDHKTYEADVAGDLVTYEFAESVEVTWRAVTTP